MGYHYNPQHYLKGWEITDHPGFIWQYDKELDAFKDLPIKAVANERGYYSDKNERKLANEVEAPAQPVIDKLRAQLPVSASERGLLAFYISTMISRGPRHRERWKSLAPGVLRELFAEEKAQIARELDHGRLPPETAEKLAADADATQEAWSKQFPPEMLMQMKDPRTSEERLKLIYLMTWRVLTTTGPSFFITSDNPVFYFDDFPLIHKECEFVFPISPTVLVHGCWQRTAPNDPWLFPAPQQIVKDLNRRVASGAVRFLFYYQRAEWVREIARKRHAKFNLIRW